MQSKKKLMGELQLTEQEVVVANVVGDTLGAAMEGCSALIVATSATPKLLWSSMPGFFWKKFVTKEKAMPGFSYPQMPEQVCFTPV